jgi:hypothetical protein
MYVNILKEGIQYYLNNNLIRVVDLDPDASEIICNLGSGSVINSGSVFGSKLSSVSN